MKNIGNRWIIAEWTFKKKKYKELWWKINKKEYLDTYSLCFFGVGQTATLKELLKDRRCRLPNKKELKALNEANLKAFFKL